MRAQDDARHQFEHHHGQHDARGRPNEAKVPTSAATVMMARKVSGEIVVVAMCIVQGPGGIAGRASTRGQQSSRQPVRSSVGEY